MHIIFVIHLLLLILKLSRIVCSHDIFLLSALFLNDDVEYGEIDHFITYKDFLVGIVRIKRNIYFYSICEDIDRDSFFLHHSVDHDIRILISPLC